MGWVAVKSIDQADYTTIGREENSFAIRAEFKASPFQIFFLWNAERCKWPLNINICIDSAEFKKCLIIPVTLSKDLRSYNLTLSELTPAAKMSPSGSKAATGLLDKCINPWQLGERRSHNRRVLSSEPERNMSSIGLMDKVTTLYLKRN